MENSYLFAILLCIVVVTLFSSTADAQLANVQHKRECGYQKECVLGFLCNNNNYGITLLDFRTVLLGRNNNQGCHWTEVCCSLLNMITMPYKEYVPRGCGYSNPNGLQIKLQNTEYGESQFGEFPWIVLIFENNCSASRCEYNTVAAGSLLAPNVVITSAHNIDQSRVADLMVRAGEWDTQTKTEPYTHENREVRTKIVHENFSKQLGTYDVALLILEYPFNLNHHIGTICLPSARRFIDYSRCVVMGWGKKNPDDPEYPHLLKRIQLPFVENGKCEEQLQRTRLGPHYKLHESFICAGGEQDRDACFGDGGAPLVCPLKGAANRFQLIGIVSWGLGCGMHKVPGVYANVRYLQPWIKDQLRENGISSTHYL